MKATENHTDLAHHLGWSWDYPRFAVLHHSSQARPSKIDSTKVPAAKALEKSRASLLAKVPANTPNDAAPT